MAKFFRLVKNEYIKTFKKVSTKIMIILIILSAIGLSVFSLLGKHTMDSYSEYSENFNEDISWLEKSKPEGYESDIKLYKYLNEHNVKPGEWKANFAFAAEVIVPESEFYGILDNVIGGGDWKAACETLKNYAKDSAQKWEYEYRLENDIPFGGEWQDDVIASIVNAKRDLSYLETSTNPDTEEKKEYEEAEKIGLYRLENNISTDASETPSLFETSESSQVNFWTVFFQSASLVSVIGLLIIIIAGSCVSNEFSQGTIKFLLINPIKRWKILMSKYFTVITFGYLMILLLFAVMIPAAGIFVGFDGISASYLYISDGAVKEMSPFLHAAILYLLNSVNVVVMATMAFALSSLFKSSALAIGTGVFCMFAGSTIIQILALLKQDWARYLIFANTNLADIYNGNSLFPQHSIIFALVVIAVHMFIFILTAWDGFTKREC